MARGPTKLQQQYKREQAKLKRRVRTAEKRGFVFGPNIVPEMPGRITQKSLQAIHSLRGDILYAQAQAFIDPTSGEAFDPEGIGHALRQKAAMKGVETRKRRRFGGGGTPAEEDDLQYIKLQNWLDNYEAWTYGGNRKYKRNMYWENLMKMRNAGVRRIETLVYGTYSELMSEYITLNKVDFEKDSENSNFYLKEAQKYARIGIAKNIKKAGVDIDEATEGLMHASTEEQLTHHINQIVSAVTGRPLTMDERKDIALIPESDGTDFTNEDKYPT